MTDTKKPIKKAVKKTVTKSSEFVIMQRDGKNANVHKNEVDNYTKGGWSKC
jgi:hypothetical protein